jgi:hypothetical protein
MVGLRLDFKFTAKAVEHLCDVTVVSANRKNERKSNWAWIKMQLNHLRNHTKKNTRSLSETSPILSGAESLKTTKYLPLMRMVELQTTQGLHTTPPIFHAAAITSEGLFGLGTEDLVSALVGQGYVTAAQKGWVDEWGDKIHVRVARFRRRLRHQVAMAAIMGNAKMCRLAGTPWTKKN